MGLPGAALIPIQSHDLFQIEACGLDITETSRDTLRVGILLVLDAVWHMLVHVRTKVSVSIPLAMIFYLAIAYPISMEGIDDGGFSIHNIAIFKFRAKSKFP